MRRWLLLLGRILAWAGALVLAGCAVAPVQDALPPDLPAQWTSFAGPAGDAITDTIEAGAARDSLSADWWRGFGNAELDGFVMQAQAQSQDIAAAMARVRQAQASARIAGASLLPEVSAGIASAWVQAVALAQRSAIAED
ncbi:MAG: TolC family protein, partial [Pusillimonas sp.]